MSTVSLPKAIQKQLEDAAEIERALAEQEVSAENQAMPEQPSHEPSVAQPEEEVQQPIVAAEQTATETEKKPEDDAAYWRKRFETVQGVLDVEVRQRKELKQALDEMQRQLQEREQQKSTEYSLISEKDEEVFGSDLIDLARRAAREEFSRLAGSLVADIRRELNPVREQVGKVVERQAMTAEEQFFNTLSQAVPDWEQINADTRWLRWLEEVDPILGAPRQLALDDAHQKLDVRRVIALFNTWKDLFVAKQQKVNNRELERQVAPPKTTSSAAVPNAPKIWSRADYERAYDPRLARAMEPEKINALRAEADRAAAEGRVRW